jgi:hypothetical protein
VAAGLLVHEHAIPGAVRVDVAAVVRGEVALLRLHEARDEALAHERALPVAPVGVEAVAHHAPAVPHGVGHDGHERQRHLGEIDVRVADGRSDRVRLFAYFQDPHAPILLT